MNSDDVLDLSLDEIIKKKRKLQRKRGGGRGTGRGGGRGGRGGGRGDGGGGGRGGGRGVGKGRAAASRGRGRGRGKGRDSGGRQGVGRAARGVVSHKLNRGGGRGRRGQRALSTKTTHNRAARLLEAITSTISRPSDRNSTQNSRTSIYGRLQGRGRGFQQQQQSQQQQLITRKKLQNARRTLLSASQQRQQNARQNRLNIVNARRGISVYTKNNEEEPLQVRIGNGTVVRGLRSDQIVLERLQANKEKINRVQPSKTRVLGSRMRSSIPTSRMRSSVPSSRIRNSESASNRGSSHVTLSRHGLTVSIRNNIASSISRRNGAAERRRPRLNRDRLKSSPAIFTVVNDQVDLGSRFYPESFEYEDNSYDSYNNSYVEPEHIPYSSTKRNFIVQPKLSRRERERERDRSEERNDDRYIIPSIADKYRVLPEPHRQTLDPKVQKEIAMLQGKEEVNLNNGPGPGVKNFSHIPSHTHRTLHQRFTQEPMPTRIITV